MGEPRPSSDFAAVERREIVVSGSPLGTRYVEVRGDDGSRYCSYASLLDTRRRIWCYPNPASDAVERCLPIYGGGVGFFAPPTFRDASCSRAVEIASVDTRCDDRIAMHGPWFSWYERADECRWWLNAHELQRVEGPFYRETDGVCARYGEHEALYAPVVAAPSDFTEIQRVTVGDGRLRAIDLHVGGATVARLMPRSRRRGDGSRPTRARLSSRKASMGFVAPKGTAGRLGAS